jgi:uncharacterized repeat protein (TIGR03803 family)
LVAIGNFSWFASVYGTVETAGGMKILDLRSWIVIVSLVATALPGCARPAEGLPQVAARPTAPFVRDASGSGYSLLYSFGGGHDGSWPAAGLTVHNGRFFGTTTWGGHSYGTVYKLTTGGAETVLYRFTDVRGPEDPQADLLAIDNTLYSTAPEGGSKHVGAVFAITTTGRQHVVYSFKKSSDVSGPTNGLVQLNGTMYGTASNGGGAQHDGGVFAVTPSGKERVVHRFSGAPGDGAYPTGKLMVVNGVLYGVTIAGGSHDRGTIFSLTPSGKETVLYSFKGGTADGAAPIGLMMLDGTFYLTTANGGDSSCNDGCGTIAAFKIGDRERTLHKFVLSEGVRPSAPLLAYNGRLYGVACAGGEWGNGFTCSSGSSYQEFGAGSLFRIAPDGSFTVLHYFEGGDGATPMASLIAYRGFLYGTARNGGNEAWGTVFRVAP